MTNIKIIAILIITFCCSCVLRGQAHKEIFISHEEPYSDHIALKHNSDDMDLIVKFAFNEVENSLTVSLISYRKLFVFRENAQYSKITSWGNLNPDKLPYVVESDAEVKYKFSTQLKQSIKPNKGKHIFKRWISYSGLQPQPVDFKMVNDYIEQKFDILNNATEVEFSLYDIVLMDEKLTPKKKWYELLYFRNLDTKYNINIYRNPCFGKEEEIAESLVKVEEIKAEYQIIREKHSQDSVQTKESVEIFNQLKEVVLDKFHKENKRYKCSQTQDNIITYNKYVDSIKMLNLIYIEPKEMLLLSPDYVLQMARALDNIVAKWKYSNDKAERRDIEQEALRLIDEIESQIIPNKMIDEQLKNAIIIFNRAQQFFYQTCPSSAVVTSN